MIKYLVIKKFIDNCNGGDDVKEYNIGDIVELDISMVIFQDCKVVALIFEDYLIPLAEWREKQINSILED